MRFVLRMLLAGVPGFEPGLAVPETAGLPGYPTPQLWFLRFVWFMSDRRDGRSAHSQTDGWQGYQPRPGHPTLALMRSSVLGRPRISSDSNRGGLTSVPVTAALIGWNALFGLSSRSAASRLRASSMAAAVHFSRASSRAATAARDSSWPPMAFAALSSGVTSANRNRTIGGASVKRFIRSTSSGVTASSVRRPSGESAGIPSVTQY